MPVTTGTATARAGLAGNPSDLYEGAVVSIPVPRLTAAVEVADAERLTIRRAGESIGWSSVGELVAQVSRFGHEGGDRLVTAAVARLARAASDGGSRITADAFAVAWNTTIPRSVGLAGSSALVVATMRALCERWGTSIDPVELAVLALEAERDDLGIPAGMQDRIVQAVGAPVHMDFRGGASRPMMRRLVPARELRLFVAWTEAAAAPSARYHQVLRERYDAEPRVRSDMRRLAALADDAATAIERGDGVALADIIDASFAIRSSLAPVAGAQLAMVTAARRAGAAATSAGSGGSIVGIARDGGAVSALDGCSVLEVRIG